MSAAREVVLVAAVARNGVIGVGGGMPWHLPADLRRFRELTMGHPMVMGRATFEAIGRALPGRRSIVLTRDPTWGREGAEVARSLEAALDLAGAGPVMVIGGGDVFAAALAYADRLEITHVDAEPDGDTYFPTLDPRRWRSVAREEEPDVGAFVTYVRADADSAGHRPAHEQRPDQRRPAGGAASGGTSSEAAGPTAWLPDPTVGTPEPAAAHEHGHERARGPGHGHGDEHARGPLADASVRRARMSDAPAVGLVQAAVWTDTFTGLLAPEVLEAFTGPAFATPWRDSLAHPPSARHVLLVACAGDQVVGFAALGPSPDPDGDETTADLLAVGVHPGARRAGHGSRLVNAVVDTARELGFDRLTAWVPMPAESLRGLLVAAGMGPDGARRQRVVDPDGRTVMEARLDAALGPGR